MQLQEMETTLRHIATLARMGQLEQEAADPVLDSLDRHRRQLIHRLNVLVGRNQQAKPALTAVQAVDSVMPTALVPRADDELPMAILVEKPAPRSPRAVVVHHVAESPKKPVIIAEPPPPRRSLGEMLAAFMEERNILWGELVGGLLIVGCSIALVVSLRETLAAIRYFPFLVVATVTAALIGAGRYTLSHWKLESTSRGLLVIGTMMVPLSFMVLASTAGGREGGPLEIGIEAAAIALFTWLVRGAANIVVRQPIATAAPRPDWLATLSVIGTSLSLLLVPYVEEVSDKASGLLGLVGYAPAAVFVLTQALTWQAVYRRKHISTRQAGGLFLALGLSLYAVCVAFIFLLCHTEIVGQALEYLAVPVALAGLPLLLGGTIASARLQDADRAGATEPETGALSRGMAGFIATMLSLGGALVLLLALAAAWPHPVRLTLIGSINFVVLSFVAHRFRLAPAYVPAQLCLAVAVLTGFHVLVGHLEVSRPELSRRLLASWFSPVSGVVLIVLAGVLAAVAEWYARRHSAIACQFVVWGAGVAAVASLVLVAVDGRDSPGRAACVFGACAAGVLLINTRWRLAWLVSAAAAILFAALFFGLHWYDAPMPVAQKFVWSLFADAAIAVLLALGVDRVASASAKPRCSSLRHGFVVPLEYGALTASVAAALAMMPALRWGWLFSAAIAAVGIGGVWLILAWRQRQPVLFAAFQGALAVAALFGCVCVLQMQSWFTHDLAGLLNEVRSWQLYGLGLSALALASTTARFGLRKIERALALLEPGWPAADRLLLGGLVVLAVLVTTAGVAAGVVEELTPLPANVATPTTTGSVLDIHAPLTWCWLGVLALALVLALWQARARSAIPGLTLVGLCGTVSVAAAFGGDVAVASGARWALALFFLGCSMLLWTRAHLVPIATALGIHFQPAPTISTSVRTALVAGAVAPVLLLTITVAAIGFARMNPSGPIPASFFAQVGPIVNNLTPLAVLCVGLAGHGIMERSSRYAFAAGQVALATVVGGYALGIVTTGSTIGSREFVQLGQLATAVTGAWLLAWVGVRRLGRTTLLNPITPSPPTIHAVLRAIQDGLTWASYLLWLAPALLLLAFPGAFPMFQDAATVVKQEAGSWLGWLVVGVGVAAAIAYRLDAAAALRSWVLGLAASLAGCVISCTVAIYAPAWDQRTLMLVAALLSLGFVITLMHWSVRQPSGWLVSSTDTVTELFLACGAGGFAVVLAVERAVTVTDCYWPAVAVGIVAAAATTAALLHRGEGWMFTANLLAMLAASLVVCGAYPPQASTAWVVLLVQVNLATAGLVGLFWLCFLQCIAPTALTKLHIPPWLCVQHGITYLTTVALLALAFAFIVAGTGAVASSFVLAVGNVGGWLALAPAVAGMIWLLRLLAPRQTLHALASSGLIGGVLLACTVTHVDLGRLWLGHHVMTFAWLLTAAGVLFAGWLVDRRRPAEGQLSQPWWAELLHPKAAIGWVIGIGMAVAGLAFASGWADPYRPYWPCAAVLAASVLIGALAVWKQSGGFVYGSGLLISAAGHLAWIAWAETKGISTDGSVQYRLILVHIICLAGASLVWTVVELMGDRTFRLPMKGIPPFRHLAAWTALAALVLTVGASLNADMIGGLASPHDVLLWFAIVAVLGAAAATLCDRPEQRWAGPLPQLYVLGLLTIGAVLHHSGFARQWLVWNAAVLLGPYVLIAALACHLGLRFLKGGASLGMPARPDGWQSAWFVPAQAIVSGIAAVLCVWICLVFVDLGPRLAGFLPAALLAVAWALLTLHWSRLTVEWKRLLSHGTDLLVDIRLPRSAALLFGVLAVAGLHCAFVGPGTSAPWLHRSVLLMAALTWCSALYGVVLPRLLPVGSEWAWLARRLASPLGLAACGILLLILLQEFFLYDPDRRQTPLTPSFIILVCAAFAVLIGAALTFALSPARDLFRLSERPRTLHVYAAEALMALLLVHLRLCVPDIFPSFLGRFWVFTVMAVAFLGVGLSEICKRRGVRVLADPLQRTAMFLPVLPLAAFLAQPLQNARATIDATFAGMQPWTRYLDRLPADYHWHAAVWFLVGLLYLAIALTRRSSKLAIAAAVLANFGLWVLFGNSEDLAFRHHPQLWLIPIGLIVLAAEQINRARLPAAQAVALRYAGLLFIYLSSSADMFITGLGQSVALPVILALLSVAGVLLGILLRVRAFLFLGVTFLLLVVFSQIWHAAVDRAQTWVWWASGIVLGAAILTLFALFEKRRNDVLKMIDEIKCWR
jgi:hypothetical protein